MNKLTPGTRVKITKPDDSDLRQGITQNMEGVVLETSKHWEQSYPYRTQTPYP